MAQSASYISHLTSYLSHLQFLPSQHQFCACLVVELRGDIQALCLGERIARAKLSFFVSIFNQGKISPVDIQPCWFHVSNGPHEAPVIIK